MLQSRATQQLKVSAFAAVVTDDALLHHQTAAILVATQAHQCNLMSCMDKYHLPDIIASKQRQLPSSATCHMPHLSAGMVAEQLLGCSWFATESPDLVSPLQKNEHHQSAMMYAGALWAVCHRAWHITERRMDCLHTATMASAGAFPSLHHIHVHHKQNV